MHPRKITGTSRHYLVALPARSCRRDQIRPGTSVSLHVRVGDQFTQFPTRVLTWARGLYVTIPRPWRLSEGLTLGDSVCLTERAPRVFELHIVEGASEKELHRRMEVLMRLRIEAARAEVQAAYQAGVRQGKSLGYSQAYAEFSRRRQCFNPEHSRSESRSPTLPETITQDLSDEPSRE